MADELLEVSGQALARESEIHQSTPIGFLIGCSAQIGFKWHHAWYLEMCQNCGIKIGGVTSIKNIIFTLFFMLKSFNMVSHQYPTNHKPPTTRAVQVRSSVSCERTWCIRCSRNSIAVRWSQDCWPSVAKHLNTWTGLQLGQKVAI